MREIRTSGSTRGQWVTSSRPLAYSTGPIFLTADERRCTRITLPAIDPQTLHPAKRTIPKKMKTIFPTPTTT